MRILEYVCMLREVLLLHHIEETKYIMHDHRELKGPEQDQIELSYY